MAVKYLDSTGLGYVWSKFKAWCNATFAAITHNHTGSQVVLTGYSKPANVSSIGTTDTTNQAIGKLEAKIDAIDIGQFGSAAAKNAVDCNTLITQGIYRCTGCTIALHYPLTDTCFIKVLHGNNDIIQIAQTTDVRKIFARVSYDNGVSWNGWVPYHNFSYSDKYIYVAKDGSDTNTGLSNADPVLSLSKALEIAMGLKCTGAIYICFGPGEWGDVWIRPNDFNACAIGFTNYSNSSVTTVADFEALTDSSARGNQPPHFSHIYVDFGGSFILGNISFEYIMVESGFLRSWQTFSFACIRSFNSKVNFSSHIVHKNENLHDGVLIIEYSTLVIGKADNKFVDTPAPYAYIVAVMGNSIYIEPGTTWAGTFNGKKYNFSLGYTCVHSMSMPPEQWPGTTGNDGVHSYKGITYAKNVVAKGTIPVISSMSDVAIRGTAPSTHQQLYQVFQDVNGVNFSGIVHNYYINRKSDLSLICHKGITNNYDYSVILALGYDENGNWFTYAPTPDLADISEKIATTRFVRELRREVIVGLETLNGDNSTPWYKVAQCTCDGIYLDYRITFLVENTYAPNNWGILEVSVRKDTTQVNLTTSTITWLVKSGFDVSNFVLVIPPVSDAQVVELWTRIPDAWMGRKFTVLTEGTRTGIERIWQLFNRTSGYADIPTEGTRKVSVTTGHAYSSDIAYSLSEPCNAGQIRINTNSTAHLRMITGNRGFFFRFDGYSFYLLKTADNDPNGIWDNSRPFTVDFNTGNVTIECPTFTTYAAQVINRGYPTLTLLESNINKDVAPEANYYNSGVIFRDVNSNAFCSLEHGYLTNRGNRLNLICWNAVFNPGENVQIAVGFDGSGNWYTYAPTPASNCNSYYIANAEFVRVHHSSGSDKRIKQDFANVPEDLLDTWDNVSWQQYRLINEVKESGDDAPTRFGIVVQDVQELLKDNNIDPDQYGFMYHLKYQGTDGDEPTEDNPEITKADKWYLNYNEALSIEAAYQRRKNKILERRISELETQVENMLQVLESLKGA